MGFLKIVEQMRLFFFVSFGIYSAFSTSNNRLFSSLKNAKTPLEISRKITTRQFLEFLLIRKKLKNYKNVSRKYSKKTAKPNSALPFNVFSAVAWRSLSNHIV